MLAHVWATVYVYVHSCTSATQGDCMCTRHTVICVPTSHCVGRGFGYIRYESGDFVLSVCDINGREQ